ncbi:uncharacterized protein [Eurosta solidaginis]|uniref:uncharacterized protein n=1 Tax=Eurosta solidaginis TaxID=178769 RepID=UPI00353133A8
MGRCIESKLFVQTNFKHKLFFKMQDDEHKFTPARIRRKRNRLRRLASNPTSAGDQIIKKEEQSKVRNFLRKVKRVLCTTLFLSIAAAVLLGHHLTQNNAKQTSLLQDFLSSYRRNYYQIIHGKPHYCDIELDTKFLFARIGEHQILHQQQALQQLEMVLRNQSHFRSIAFVGPSGVGKTMTANALETHFPWRENVHSYAWNTHVEEEAQKIRMLRFYVEHLSDCGRNLLIIDNLAPCESEVVAILNQMIAAEDNAYRKHVIVIYIFHLNALLDSNLYQKQKYELQNLPDTTTIHFKALNKEELRECIQRETLTNNLTLNDADFNEIVDTIDVTTSGCKKVQAKVLLYGQRLDEINNLDDN